MIGEKGPPRSLPNASPPAGPWEEKGGGGLIWQTKATQNLSTGYLGPATCPEIPAGFAQQKKSVRKFLEPTEKKGTTDEKRPGGKGFNQGPIQPRVEVVKFGVAVKC